MSELNESPVSGQSRALSAEALARRKVLLKSLGKSSAVVAAAAVPMHTLASSPTLFTADGTRCSISGMQSGNNSRLTRDGVCTGKSPGYWHKFEHWTEEQKLMKDLPFGILFGDVGNRMAGATLKEIVCSIGNDDGEKGMGKKVDSYSMKYNNTAEWHWCCAWMNAQANNRPGTGVRDFPYTPRQVIAIYQNPSSFNTTRDEALMFFKKLEN